MDCLVKMVSQSTRVEPLQTFGMSFPEVLQTELTPIIMQFEIGLMVTPRPSWRQKVNPQPEYT